MSDNGGLNLECRLRGPTINHRAAIRPIRVPRRRGGCAASAIAWQRVHVRYRGNLTKKLPTKIPFHSTKLDWVQFSLICIHRSFKKWTLSQELNEEVFGKYRNLVGEHLRHNSRWWPPLIGLVVRRFVRPWNFRLLGLSSSCPYDG